MKSNIIIIIIISLNLLYSYIDRETSTVEREGAPLQRSPSCFDLSETLVHLCRELSSPREPSRQ